MLVESLLGVDEKIIMQDYAASYFFQRRKFFWNKVGLVVAPITLRFKKILFGMMAAKPKYIQTIMNELKQTYGSMVEYCKQVLDITDEDIATMKQKYLE
jgi:protein tyrosine/serine phosphatase